MIRCRWLYKHRNDAFEFRENSIVVTIPFNRLELDDTTQVTTQVATQVIERQLNEIEIKNK